MLSVIIPYFNLGEFIDETLDSAIASNHRPLEIIIVNDGSTDAASRAKLNQIESRALPDVRIVHGENQGLASARNRGLCVARGEFVALLDADDKIEPDFYTRAIDVLNRYPNVGFVYSWVRYFEAGSGIWPTWNAEFPYLLGHNMTCVLAVIRRKAFLEVGGANPVFAYNYEDYAGWIALADAGWAGVSIPEPLVQYRIRPGSMLRSRTDDQFLYLHDLMTQMFPRLYSRYGGELFNLQNANGPGREWNHPAIEASPPPSESLLAHMNALEAQRASLEKYLDDLRLELERQIDHGRSGWAEAERLAEAWAEQGRQIGELRAMREESERLAHAWEQHTRHIRELTDRVAELETVKDRLWNELQEAIAANGEPPLEQSARGWRRLFGRRQ